MAHRYHSFYLMVGDGASWWLCNLSRNVVVFPILRFDIVIDLFKIECTVYKSLGEVDMSMVWQKKAEEERKGTEM